MVTGKVSRPIVVSLIYWANKGRKYYLAAFVGGTL
jgi:hypothetical protein